MPWSSIKNWIIYLFWYVLSLKLIFIGLPFWENLMLFSISWMKIKRRISSEFSIKKSF
jgi:hypothetical protein